MLYVWVRAGFLLGLRPRVFASASPSMACAGVYVRVGVIAWVRVRKGVRGLVGGVVFITLGWV